VEAAESDGQETTADPASADQDVAAETGGQGAVQVTEPPATESEATEADTAESNTSEADGTEADTETATASAPSTSLAEHVAAVDATDVVRLLDDDLSVLIEDDASRAFEALRDAEGAPRIVVLDGEISQRIVDVASQRGVSEVVGASAGEFVKQPTSVRVRTFADVR
jgi:hypothetical protein